jgi:hypothetical protein
MHWTYEARGTVLYLNSVLVQVREMVSTFSQSSRVVISTSTEIGTWLIANQNRKKYEPKSNRTATRQGIMLFGRFKCLPSMV